MGKNRNKLRYVKGTCELEKGVVSFVGGMSGVSTAQTWYHVIYAIKDKFPEIDFWIDPKLDCCETLPSTANYLRYGLCKSFNCSYEEFPNGEIKPKRKLSALDKRKYNENRSKVDLGVNIEFVPVLPVFEFNNDNIEQDLVKCIDVLKSYDYYDMSKLTNVSNLITQHENLLDNIEDGSYNKLLSLYQETRELSLKALQDLQGNNFTNNFLLVSNIGLKSFICMKKLRTLMEESWNTTK